MKKEFADIGFRLEEIRKEKHKTQEDVAEICKITVEYYRKLESGESIPSIRIIDFLYKACWDIDYILTGHYSEKSVFSDVLDECNENVKFDICNILIFKMIEMLHADGKCNENESMELVLLGDRKPITSIEERIQEAILNEIGRLKFGKSEMAEALDVSIKTVTRLLSGETDVKIGMIMSLYRKYNYTPSYILYGDINSNSKCDLYYNRLTGKQKKEIIKFAGNIVKVWQS